VRTESKDPPLDAVLAVDPAVLSGKLLTIPDEENALLRLADGRRTVEQLVRRSGLDEARALDSLGRLLESGVLRVLSRGPDGADWFADPGSAAAAAGEAEPAMQAPPAALDPPMPLPEPLPDGRGRVRAWVVGAAVALGALLLGGALWAGRQRSPPPVPPVAPTREVRPAAEGPPPALVITEQAPSAAYREAMAEVTARYQAGDLAGAAAACRRAIEVDPTAGAGWMALGEVQLAAGDRASARVAFDRYLALEPEGAHAPRIRALLERLRP
jgi:tetratricopeptide (TPR) repeat protein